MERKSEQLLSKCTAISVHSTIIVWVNAGGLTKVSMKQSPVLHCCFIILYQPVRYITTILDTPTYRHIQNNMNVPSHKE